MWRREDHLFVYGTLRGDVAATAAPANPARAALAAGARLLGRGRMRGRLFDLGAYPGAVPANAGFRVVRGEVFALLRPHAVLSRLDAYEGCGPEDPEPAPFRRQRVMVEMDDGGSLGAWAYVYHGDTRGLRPIPSGDYAAYLSASRATPAAVTTGRRCRSRSRGGRPPA